MKAKLHILCAIIALACSLGQAFAQQQSALKFNELSFDFGSIREDGGPVSHTFSFRNDSDGPIVVISATSTCGCTVPTVSQRPVLSGGNGVVEVTFDPMNRPGRFDKRITVVTSEKDARPVFLNITGSVVPREKGVDELYPAFIGYGLRAETNFHSFSYVEHGKMVRTGIGLINTSDKTLTLKVVNTSGRGVFRAEPSSMVLKAGQKGEITVSGDMAVGCGIYGTITEHLVFEINGRRSDAELVITGIAVDNRDEHPDNAAPKAELNTSVVKFGVLKPSSGARTAFFEILNSGDAVLTIRAVEGVPEGTELSIGAGERIAAGERRKVGVTVYPSKRNYGPSVERIRLITDDPSRPMRDVKVTMSIEN